MNSGTVSQTTSELGMVMVTFFSAVGTGLLFQDVKESCRGLLETPIGRFLIMWSFCFTLLKDQKKAIIAALFLHIFYNIMHQVKDKYEEQTDPVILAAR